MSRMALADRLKTVAITATLTSAAWILFGGGIMNSLDGNLAVLRKVDPVASSAPPSRPASKPLAKQTARPLPAATAGDYLLPVAGIRPDQLTDTFSQARGGGTRVHDAIDIMAPRGTPVLAAVGGTVEKLFTSKPGGLTIYVRSPDKRTITYYAHLDAYAPGLAEGQQVRRGQQIGTVGFTGNANPSAPHLHFAIMETMPDASWWEPANAINPYPLLVR